MKSGHSKSIFYVKKGLNISKNIFHWRIWFSWQKHFLIGTLPTSPLKNKEHSANRPKKRWWSSIPKILLHTKIKSNVKCQTPDHCDRTPTKYFVQFKNLSVFSASSKTFVPLQKLLCQHKNQIHWIEIIFWCGTKCFVLAQNVYNFLDWHKTFCEL